MSTEIFQFHDGTIITWQVPDNTVSVIVIGRVENGIRNEYHFVFSEESNRWIQADIGRIEIF